MTIKKIYILLALLLPAFFLQAQATRQIDSLRKVVQTSTNHKQLIRVYTELSGSVNLENFDQNIMYARLGLNYASKDNDSTAIGTLYINLGNAHYFRGSFDSASVYFYKAIDVLGRTKDDKQLALAYNYLAKLYRKTKSLTRAHQFYDKAMVIYQRLRDESGIATIYNESGVVYEYEGKYDDAIRNYQASLNINKKLNDSVGIGYALNFIAGVYTIKEDFTEAENYNLEALRIRELLKDTFSIMLTWSDLGTTYKAEGNLAKATESYLKSNIWASSKNYPELMLNNYQALSSIAAQQNDYTKAYEYVQRYNILKDSVYRIESSKQIEELSAKYETVEKEKQIQQQQFEITRRNYWLAGIIATSLLLALLGYSYYRRYRLKQNADMQAALIRQQDIATRAIIEAEEKERRRIAGDLHDGVGQMMSAARMNLSAIQPKLDFADEEQRTNFEKVVSLIDESCAEVRSVSHNMMPNALVKSGLASAVKEFLDKINTNIIKVNFFTEGLDQKIDSNVESVLYRIIQECVNNVLKHSGATLLDISLVKETDNISVTIEDNGKGFDTSDATRFQGIGLKNIISRINYLKGMVEWDAAPGKGTLVAIHVPSKT